MLKKILPDRIRNLSFAAGLLLGLSFIPLKAADETPSVLITYTYQHELLPQSTGGPVLTIYSNGDMQAIFPSYMKRAGTNQAQLSADKLQTLQAFLATETIQNFTAETIAEEIELQQAQQEQAGNSNETLYAVLDSTTTIIEYQTPDNGTNETVEGGATPSKKIVQKDLSVAAKQYPGISVIQDANNLKGLLQNILDTTDWKPVRGNL